MGTARAVHWCFPHTEQRNRRTTSVSFASHPQILASKWGVVCRSCRHAPHLRWSSYWPNSSANFSTRNSFPIGKDCAALSEQASIQYSHRATTVWRRGLVRAFDDAESVGSTQLLSMQDFSGHPKAYAAFRPPNFGAILAINRAKLAGFEGCGVSSGLLYFSRRRDVHPARAHPTAPARLRMILRSSRSRRSPPFHHDYELPLLDDNGPHFSLIL
jgi:hypothetical protein